MGGSGEEPCRSLLGQKIEIGQQLGTRFGVFRGLPPAIPRIGQARIASLVGSFE